MNTTLVYYAGQFGQRFHLKLTVFNIHGAFNTQVERFCDFFQFGQIIGHCFKVIIAKSSADSAIHVNVENRQIILTSAQFQNTIPQPGNVLFQQFSVFAQLGFYVVDQSMRQYVGLFDDHFIRVFITIVAGLSENRDFLIGNSGAIFFRHYFAHHLMFRLSNSIQNCLCYAVTNGSVELFARFFRMINHFCQATEAVCFLSYQHRGNLVFDYRDEILSQKQRITAAGTRILDSSTVAVSNLSIFQHKHDGNSFASLADRSEAVGYRITNISSAVGNSAFFNGALIIKEETGSAFGANNFGNFHN